ncbi:hypothetical protein LTR78_001062 [Recurvomyces mirabilis]|uniref:Uncharacterized protein n=1 Tax=Recurvomyces mirabilis TaxID=574656 RepID=A0AAE0WW85_9PEZI|nr:hypothetical protein LTR78_001062 [Recurvomyces mirabilis]KAK5159034.1 hypothetical protein LTS14_003142 [Recurvomyces mirabilis]
MPSEASASLAGAANPTCENCGTNIGLQRIDGTKVNDLVDCLRDRLSRDVHGNFFLEGAKTGKDTRHGQLGDLFSLLANLEGFKATMDKHIALHSPKEVVKPEKPITMNQNMTAVVKSMVEQMMDGQLRDLSIRCERLEGELKDVKKSRNLTVAKVSKTASTGTESSHSAAARKVVSAEVAKVETRLTTTVSTQVANLDLRIAGVTNKQSESSTHGDRIHDLERANGISDYDIRGLEARMADVERNFELRAEAETQPDVKSHEDRLSYLEYEVTRLAISKDLVLDDIGKLRSTVGKLKDWQHDMTRWKADSNAAGRATDEQVARLLRRGDVTRNGWGTYRHRRMD